MPVNFNLKAILEKSIDAKEEPQLEKKTQLILQHETEVLIAFLDRLIKNSFHTPKQQKEWRFLLQELASGDFWCTCMRALLKADEKSFEGFVQNYQEKLATLEQGILGYQYITSPQDTLSEEKRKLRAVQQALRQFDQEGQAFLLATVSPRRRGSITLFGGNEQDSVSALPSSCSSPRMIPSPTSSIRR